MTIVVDASVAVGLIADAGEGSQEAVGWLSARGDSLHAPHLLDVEVASALRRQVRRQKLTPAAASRALADLQGLPIRRYPHGPLLGRALELRDNLTTYDAVYLALAEALDATLVTGDSAFAAVPAPHATVHVIGSL